jgi:hypothetical protein
VEKDKIGPDAVCPARFEPDCRRGPGAAAGRPNHRNRVPRGAYADCGALAFLPQQVNAALVPAFRTKGHCPTQFAPVCLQNSADWSGHDCMSSHTHSNGASHTSSGAFGYGHYAKDCESKSQTGDARKEARDIAERPIGQSGEKPQASDSNRTLRGAQSRCSDTEEESGPEKALRLAGT